MTFLRLRNDRLRISLSKNETEQIFGNAESINQNDPRVQTALRALLKKVLRDSNFKPVGYSLWVEVVKNLTGGYDIYFTKSQVNNEESCIPLLMLEFKTCQNAITASKSFVKLSSQYVESKFYRFLDRYHMIIHADKGLYDLPGMIEFTDNILFSSIEIAKTKEYGKEIIKENAIETLALL